MGIAFKITPGIAKDHFLVKIANIIPVIEKNIKSEMTINILAFGPLKTKNVITLSKTIVKDNKANLFIHTSIIFS